MKQFPLFLFLFLALQACGQKEQLGLSNGYRAKIEASLNLGIQHASEACLDEVGKARGDYEMISGKWSEYEPAWHTGQLIQGLLMAYEVTQNERALEQARKAGDWWISLQFPEGISWKGI